MEFTPMDAAQYRALSRDAFIERRQQVIDLLNAETLPEGVDLENLLAEADIIDAEVSLRNRQESARQKASARLNDAYVEERNAKATNVLSGEGQVVDTTKAQKRSGFEVVSEQPYSTTYEYRKALHDHILRIRQMPGEMAFKAYRDNTAVSMNADYTNMTDTFANTFSGLAVAPMDLSDAVIRELHEKAVLLDKVNQTFEQGMIAMSELDLQATGAWIGDKEVSPYQDEYDPEVFTWTWHQFECRFARTMLAEAIMRDNYKAQLAPAMAECYGYAMDAAILSGNGSTQPKGILTDTRLVGSDGKGKTTDGSPSVVGKALVLGVTAEDVDSWSFWASLLWNENFNRLYRNDGELIIADGTWGNHISILRDQVDRPIATWNPLNEEQPYTLRGVGPVTPVANSLVKSFDNASVGDVIGVYGNFKNYTINIQPGMPLTTVSWSDHETNTNKTTLLVACDGRVSNPFGWVILKKAASA